MVSFFSSCLYAELQVRACRLRLRPGSRRKEHKTNFNFVTCLLCGLQFIPVKPILRYFIITRSKTRTASIDIKGEEKGDGGGRGQSQFLLGSSHLRRLRNFS